MIVQDPMLSTEEKIRLAWDRKALLPTLQSLANDENSEVRRRVADNSNSSTDLLVRLAKDPDVPVRVAVANNWQTPSEVLEELAIASEDLAVRISAIRNPNVTLDILWSAVDSTSAELQKAVMISLKADADLLDTMAQYTQSRRYILRNKNAEFGTIKKIFDNFPEEDIQWLEYNLYRRRLSPRAYWYAFQFGTNHIPYEALYIINALSANPDYITDDMRQAVEELYRLPLPYNWVAKLAANGSITPYFEGNTMNIVKYLGRR